MGTPAHDFAQSRGFLAPPGYGRHRPEATLLYQIVAEHYPRVSGGAGAGGSPLASLRRGGVRSLSEVHGSRKASCACAAKVATPRSLWPFRARAAASARAAAAGAWPTSAGMPAVEQRRSSCRAPGAVYLTPPDRDRAPHAHRGRQHSLYAENTLSRRHDPRDLRGTAPGVSGSKGRPLERSLWSRQSPVFIRRARCYGFVSQTPPSAAIVACDSP